MKKEIKNQDSLQNKLGEIKLSSAEEQEFRKTAGIMRYVYNEAVAHINLNANMKISEIYSLISDTTTFYFESEEQKTINHALRQSVLLMIKKNVLAKQNECSKHDFLRKKERIQTLMCRAEDLHKVFPYISVPTTGIKNISGLKLTYTVKSHLVEIFKMEESI